MAVPVTAPKYGTPEYALWAEGAADEAAARDEGLLAAHREVRDLVEGLARCHPETSAHRLAGSVAWVLCAGQPLRERLRVAWRILR